jgi:hypothetical protein
VTQQSVVDEDAVQAVADGALDEHGRDRAVDAAREPEHDLAVRADDRAHFRDLALHDARRHPIAGQPTDLVEEVREELRAAQRVADLGMELHAEEAAPRIADRGVRARVARRVHLETARQTRDLVAVAHPHDGVAGDALEDAFRALDRDRATSDLALVVGAHLAAEFLAHPLHAVADAEHRDAEFEQLLRHLGRVTGVHRRRPTRQDHPGEVHARGELERLVRRRDLAPGVRLANPPRDQLRVLRAEVDDQHSPRIAAGLLRLASGILVQGASLCRQVQTSSSPFKRSSRFVMTFVHAS